MTSHNKNGRFCVGFPHTLSALVIFIYLFICLREPIVCHVVSVRKREDPGNDCLCVAAITLLDCCHQTRTQSLFTGFKAKAVWIKWSARGVMGRSRRKIETGRFRSTEPCNRA